MQIDPVLLLDIYNSTDRYYYQKRLNYYNCKQSVPELEKLRQDGREKSNLHTPWVQYIVNMHTGFLSTKDINYTLNDETASREPLNEFKKVYDYNNLNTLDTEHLMNDLLFGESVEIHSFDKDYNINITHTNPANWTFIYDEFEQIVFAIYRVTLPPYTYYKNEILTDYLDLYYIYDNQNITEYVGYVDQISFVKETPHNYGRLPIVKFWTCKDFQSFFSDALLHEIDNFDITRSTMCDDIKYTIDSPLVIKGFNLDDLLKTNAAGNTTVMEKLKELNIWPLGKEQEVSKIDSIMDVAKIKFDLEESRRAIHTAGCVPDLTDIFNANGASQTISGIALKILYHSIIEKSAEFVSYFEIGLNNRIALINRVWELQGKPKLENYNIKIERNIPMNNIEMLQYLGNMKGIISIRDMLSMVPDIENPQQAFNNIMSELNTQAVQQGIDTNQSLTNTNN